MTEKQVEDQIFDSGDAISKTGAYFTIANKSFPARQPSPWSGMKITKYQEQAIRAERDGNEDLKVQYQRKIFASNMDFILQMVPKKFHEALDDHLSTAEYDEDDLFEAVENALNQLNNPDELSELSPLPEKTSNSGFTTQQNESPSSRVISLQKRTVKKRDLEPEEIERWEVAKQKKGSTG